MDRWLLSRLNSTIRSVDDDLGHYRIPEAARALQSFVEDMSNWYVRRGRERYWASGMEQDKINAYMTLYTALVDISKAAAPMIPFMTEDIYRNLVCSIDPGAPESIHLCDYPVADESRIDPELEEKMDQVLQIVVLGRAARNASGVKNRQPIGEMLVKTSGKLPDYYTEIIADELNVRKVTYTDAVEGYIDYEFKPQLKTVGPKYGKKVGPIKAALAAIDGPAAWAELSETGALRLTEGGEEIILTEDDLIISVTQMEGYAVESDNGITVVLDVHMTPELIGEGLFREIVSKLQTMRREAGFEVMDHITVTYRADEEISAVFAAYGESIQKDVLATDIRCGELSGYQKEWSINGHETTLGVEKFETKR